jgi:hypothetical protein
MYRITGSHKLLLTMIITVPLSVLINNGDRDKLFARLWMVPGSRTLEEFNDSNLNQDKPLIGSILALGGISRVCHHGATRGGANFKLKPGTELQFANAFDDIHYLLDEPHQELPDLSSASTASYLSIHTIIYSTGNGFRNR